jgi:hypothetical protein
MRSPMTDSIPGRRLQIKFMSRQARDGDQLQQVVSEIVTRGNEIESEA